MQDVLLNNFFLRYSTRIMNRILVILIFCIPLGMFAQSDIVAIGVLPNVVNETSGLIFVGDKLVTHNDSDGSPFLYEIDTTSLAITRTVELLNTNNTDWEDLAEDDNYIYVGDFGNNQGNRQDLAVLRVSKNQFVSSTTVNVERIEFAYEDQDGFSVSEQTDWDAEALFVQNDSLVVLTKQWRSSGTVAYKFPKVPGTHIAVRKDSYQVDGLVTGADFDTASNTLYLIGYSQLLTPFFVQVEGVTEDSIFSGTKTKSNLVVGFAQMEAIARNSLGKLYVTSEEFSSNVPPVDSSSRLFRFGIDSEDEPEEPIDEPEVPELPEEDMDELVLSKEFGSNQLDFQLNIEEPVFGVGIYDISGRRVYYRSLEFMPQNSIDTSSLGPSIYFLTFILRDGFLSRPFIIN